VTLGLIILPDMSAQVSELQLQTTCDGGHGHAYQNFRRLEYVPGHVSWAELFPDHGLDIIDQPW
jgi:hypothetical protein